MTSDGASDDHGDNGDDHKGDQVLNMKKKKEKNKTL